MAFACLLASAVSSFLRAASCSRSRRVSSSAFARLSACFSLCNRSSSTSTSVVSVLPPASGLGGPTSPFFSACRAFCFAFLLSFGLSSSSIALCSNLCCISSSHFLSASSYFLRCSSPLIRHLLISSFRSWIFGASSTSKYRTFLPPKVWNSLCWLLVIGYWTTIMLGSMRKSAPLRGSSDRARYCDSKKAYVKTPVGSRMPTRSYFSTSSSLIGLVTS
mmetsp:Transcript_120248/g.340746  ORF Transcript_120248/g.340746 Transcript_120248/m.340746 type:complete len:219 (-) Transcript_120248:334-990(-)